MRTFLLNPVITFNTIGYGYKHPVIGCKNRETLKTITREDSEFLAMVRAVSIGVIVLGHVGGFWFFRPYSEFLHVVVPVFFFISGVFAYASYSKSSSATTYYGKRIPQLLIPYYMLCVLSLLVYVVQHDAFPNILQRELIHWLDMTPSNDIMPFPIGQVWFLHTLTIITFISPLYFVLFKISRLLFLIILFVLIFISGMEDALNIIDMFNINIKYVYLPLIHSVFYMLGIMYCASGVLSRKNIVAVCICSLIISILSVYVFKLDIDFGNHINAPDLYYISGSILTISILLLSKKIILSMLNRISLLRHAWRFAYRHTFSIFLLHTFAIYISEVIFGLTNPQQKTIGYGLTKFACVACLTIIISPPFSWLATSTTQALQKLLNTKSTSPSLETAR